MDRLLAWNRRVRLVGVEEWGNGGRPSALSYVGKRTASVDASGVGEPLQFVSESSVPTEAANR